MCIRDSPTYTRAWTWVVDKTRTSDERIIANPSTGDATASYTVTATPTKRDSGWQVSGTIHLTNANSITVTGITVEDTMAAAICTLDDPVPSSLAAGASADIRYHCTYAAYPGTGTLTNHVVVSWAASGFVAAGNSSYDATTTFSGVDPASQTGDSLTLTDSASDWPGGSITVNAKDGVLSLIHI